jgi:hypothetical protein
MQGEARAAAAPYGTSHCDQTRSTLFK